jgi:hypothetical protein
MVKVYIKEDATGTRFAEYNNDIYYAEPSGKHHPKLPQELINIDGNKYFIFHTAEDHSSEVTLTGISARGTPYYYDPTKDFIDVDF